MADKVLYSTRSITKHEADINLLLAVWASKSSNQKEAQHWCKDDIEHFCVEGDSQGDMGGMLFGNRNHHVFRTHVETYQRFAD